MENIKTEILGNNQIIIFDPANSRRIFQSYNKTIVSVIKGVVYLDSYYWDYSKTTGKFRNMFLAEGIAETRKKIKSGEYILKELN